jgi:hypothetical protein
VRVLEKTVYRQLLRINRGFDAVLRSLAVLRKQVGQWAQNSGRGELAVCMQRAINDEFDLGHNTKAKLTQGTDLEYANYEKFYQENKEGLRAMARAQYNNTQAYFKQRGIKEVYLYRGMDVIPSGVPAGPSAANITLRPASSFSTNYATSAQPNFSGGTKGLILSGTVPVERIMGTCRTGYGCLSEYEAVVLSGTDDIFDTCRGQVEMSPFSRGSVKCLLSCPCR